MSQSFRDRVRGRSRPLRSKARALVAKQGNSLEAAYDAFVETLDARPDAIAIDSSSLDEAYAALLDHLASS